MSSTGKSDHSSPGEFELIAALQRRVERSRQCDDIVLGIGDDAAVTEFKTGQQVLTTDTMVDGVHFLRDRADWKDIGWKSAVSNLSDIAAMGAAPLHALVTLGVSPDVEASYVERMYDGMISAFDEFGGCIIGGDVVYSPVFFVTVALTGRAHEIEGEPVVMRRDRAMPGDLIGVTGTLGGASGGLRALIDGLEGADADALRSMHYRAKPRIDMGTALIEGGVRCAMDISDGLVADLEKMCGSSDVGAVIDSASVPIPAELERQFGAEATEIALAGGEDYELLFTAPFDLMDRLLARHRGKISHIGRIIETPQEGDIVEVRDAEGNLMSLERKGWDHLQ